VAHESQTSLAYGFRFVEPEWVSLRDLSAAFYDLSILYDLTALISVPEGQEVNFNGRFFWTRYGRPVPPEFRAYVFRASYESPLLLELSLLPTIALAPAIIRRWTAAIEDVLDLPDRIRDRRGQRREARADRVLHAAEREARLKDLELADDARELRRMEIEIRRIEQESERRVAQTDLIAAQQSLDQALANPSQAHRELEGALEEHDANGAYANVKRRLGDSPVRAYEVEIFDWEERPDSELRDEGA
jgi:hypothetical protein